MKSINHQDSTLMTSGQFFGNNARTCRVRGFRLVENVYAKNSRTPRHAHALPHFCWVLQGEYREHLENSLLDRAESSLMFLPAGAVHAESHHSMVRSLMVELEAWRFEAVDEQKLLTEPKSIRSNEIIRLMGQLHLEFSRPDALSDLVIEALGIEILALTARDYLRKPASKPPVWLKQIHERLQDEFRKPPTLDQLAIDVGKNSSHVARAFRLQFGRSIGQYIRQVRVDHAKRYIRDEAMPLASVALRCGFTDQAHFCRSFRAVTGMTPTEYRRRVNSS